MRRVGYVRACAIADIATQVRRLKELDLEVVMSSGARTLRGDRAEFGRILSSLAPADEFVVLHLQILGRSTREVLSRLRELVSKPVVLRVLEPEISTERDTGRSLIAALELTLSIESDSLNEKRRSTLEIARSNRLHKGGRQKEVDDADIRRRAESGHSKSAIARELNVSRMTVYRALASRSTETCPER